MACFPVREGFQWLSQACHARISQALDGGDPRKVDPRSRDDARDAVHRPARRAGEDGMARRRPPVHGSGHGVPDRERSRHAHAPHVAVRRRPVGCAAKDLGAAPAGSVRGSRIPDRARVHGTHHPVGRRSISAAPARRRRAIGRSSIVGAETLRRPGSGSATTRATGTFVRRCWTTRARG